MSESLREPQLDPPESILVVIADYGPKQGGWGPAAHPMIGGPFVYSGKDPIVEEAADQLARGIARAGQESRVVRFTQRTDIATYRPGGSNGH